MLTEGKSESFQMNAVENIQFINWYVVSCRKEEIISSCYRSLTYDLRPDASQQRPSIQPYCGKYDEHTPITQTGRKSPRDTKSVVCGVKNLMRPWTRLWLGLHGVTSHQLWWPFSQIQGWNWQLAFLLLIELLTTMLNKLSESQRVTLLKRERRISLNCDFRKARVSWFWILFALQPSAA